MKNTAGAELVARLFDSHGRALVLYARQLCDDPQDAVQEAFLKLAEQRTPPRQPIAWLFRVVRNEAFMAARANGRRRNREHEVVQTRSWFQPSPDDAFDASLTTEALRNLPAEQREIVTAHLWGGLTFKEIGQLIDVSDSAAHRRYQQALDRLRSTLMPPEEEEK